MNDDDQINCKKCGIDTNHTPPEFPPEWDGYCPSCAIKDAVNGLLPKCSVEAIVGQIEAKIMATFGDGVQVQVLLGDDLPTGGMTKIGEDEDHIQFITRQCMN